MVSSKVLKVFTKTKSSDRIHIGLPKLPQNGPTRITSHGLDGDYNHYRTTKRGGNLNRAVLIFTIDMLQELQEEGWPISPGDIGENLLLEGIKYSDLSIGVRLRIGDVEVEIAEKCNPCFKLASLDYVGKENETEFIKIMKGRRGWYAKVLKEGDVEENDPITFLSTIQSSLDL